MKDSIVDLLMEEWAKDLSKQWEVALEDWFKNPRKYVPKHRNGMLDMEWAAHQRRGKPRFAIGDIVRTLEGGGYGVIDDVSPAHDGWPCNYSLNEIKGKKRPPYLAWFYEGDIELVTPGPLHP